MARPKSDIEPRIVHAARECFIEDGVDGTSLRKIARRAKTSIGMIYYYFPSKDDLFLAVVEEVYVRVLADFEKALAPDASFETRVQRLSERIGNLDEEELTMVRLVVREVLISSSRLEHLIERFQRGHLPMVMQTLQAGIVEGAVDGKRHPLVLLAATFAIAGLPQIMRKVAGPKLPFAALPAPGELSHELAHVLLHGIGRHDDTD